MLAPILTLVVAGGGALASGRSWQRMSGMRGRMGDLSEVTAANGPRVVALLLGVAALLALGVLASRTWPRASYVGVIALTAVSVALQGPWPSALVAPIFTLAALMRARPSWEWVAWAALLVPAFAASVLGDEPQGGWLSLTLWVAVPMAVAWVVAPALAFQLAGSRRASQVARREEELRRVAYEERLRVARDIHDVVGHSLSMISLQSGVALHVLESDPGQVKASLEAIRDASRSSLAELRQTLGVFRQPDEGQPLVPTPTLDGVQGLVASVRAGGREVGLAVEPDAASGVSAAVQAVGYRVVQEGLTNVVRHAPGASAVVSIGRRPEGLTVSVFDDGTARSVPVEGNGLRGMRERVEALGGTLTIGVRAGGGLAVEATLPTGAPA